MFIPTRGFKCKNNIKKVKMMKISMKTHYINLASVN